jgi:MerT mercuric transport protein
MQNVLMPIEETMPMTETGCEPQGSTRAGATEPIGDASSQRSQKLAVVGGILGAIAASSCCILPLALFSLGISGACIGNLTALAPYQPYFIAATLACLGYGYWLVYRRKMLLARRVGPAPGRCHARLPSTSLPRFC